MMFTILFVSSSFAATKTECLGGNFSACKQIFRHFGSTSERTGAVEFFAEACASENLKIACEVISSDKAETMRKALELAQPEGALFTIDGVKVDKIYRISSLETVGSVNARGSYRIEGSDSTQDSPAKAMELYNQLKKPKQKDGPSQGR